DSSFSQMREVASSVAGHRIPGYMDPRAGLRPQLPVERKWALGLQFEALSFLLMYVLPFLVGYMHLRYSCCQNPTYPKILVLLGEDDQLYM
ncbi:SNF1-related protein kinase catalytic subunit alpha KIN10, partial [Trifolium medium]|nr:SNF1-related protein kinase catalytic subunit alpha KIN10 [Trifolium medium]